MSVFLDIPDADWVASNEYAFAIRDRFPVSPGHTLVITRRVVPDWFAASPDERTAVLALVDEVKQRLDAELHPDGYNIGFNAGLAAGQTVMHLHVHVIPRFRGDMDDPRGGVRHVIPSRGNYLTRPQPLATGGEGDPFARHILPLFDRAATIAIVAAFVQESGVHRIRPALEGALQRGALVRILTGDYLEITQVAALELLLDLQSASTDGDDTGAARGGLQVRVVEVEKLAGRTRSFHPKAWRFEGPTFGTAFVGSSNLSRAALDTGIEWNLRADRDRDRQAYERVTQAFDTAWLAARPLDSAWISEYAARARRLPAPLSTPAGEVEPEALEPPLDPHEVQLEALATLRAAREQGRRRALVVLATGLGKTWLAAFDYRQFRDEVGGRPRLLFLAHRRELLLQAARTYRRLLRKVDPAARVGWCVGDTSELDADIVFASVPKLARKEQLEKLRAHHFDYVVVDEVHHAAADSYRRILGGTAPRFLLGLTATPDRADAADILGLFDDHLAYRADIARGVAVKRLVPFHYFGIKDDIDYANIPWRNRRFDPAALTQAAQTEQRMLALWQAWQEHRGGRTLVFCCSIAHAIFVREWLRGRGVRVAAVFSGEGSDERDGALAALAAGTLDAVCAVDVFNEGIDVPTIDRVVMLRPTESAVVFLQQLGRGLRASPGKDAVNVIDFVGNHRVFLERLRTLLSLGEAKAVSLRDMLDSADAAALPAGCSVELQLEAKELLARLLRTAGGGADEVERAYRDLHAERGERPTAGELHRMGYLPGRLRERHGSWFAFVAGEGHLTPAEKRVVDLAGRFLRDLETTEMTKSFKMVTLQALLDADRPLAGLPLLELAARSHEILRRSPELWADVAEEARFDALDDDSKTRKWLAYWRKNPVHAWCGRQGKDTAWFRVDSDRFVLDITVDPELHDAFAQLTRELVDYRLAQYRARRRLAETSEDGFVCRVTWNKRDPILKLPASSVRGRGETDVRLPDGAVWQFRFAKEFCNVARPAGVDVNRLPDLLRRWFGPRAGHPGTAFQVRFHASPDGLWVEPVQGEVVALAPRHSIVAYPDLRAAAGHATDAIEPVDGECVLLPLESADRDLFAVRVSGTSMDGGRNPIRDGDWAVLRVARGMPASAMADRVVLIQVPSDTFGHHYQLKRLVRRGEQWVLTSDNPSGPTFIGEEGMIPIARLERVIHPEDLAPAIGTIIGDDALGEPFGVDELLPVAGRHGGHLFIFIDRKGMLEAPDTVRYVPERGRAGETAYVLARAFEGTWRFLGVARRADETRWRVPDVDFATWRTWGEGREASRALPEGAEARARKVADIILALPDEQRWLQKPDGQRARVLAGTARGGLRIDGGEGGFAERTVSLTDLAWCAVADDDVQRTGGLLDEERVNRLRYLEGTPKASTRWIDTAWAIAAWQLAGQPPAA